MVGAKFTHNAEATPVATNTRFCLRQDSELNLSQVSLSAAERRSPYDESMSGTADRTEMRLTSPCCIHGMIAPSGWLERIVVMTIVVQAYSNNERERIDKQSESLSM